MLLSDESKTAIIVCITLGIFFTIAFLVALRFNLINKFLNYCCATKIVPIVKPKIPPMVSITVKK
jgi:hypothetical protein